jgi:TIR domain
MQLVTGESALIDESLSPYEALRVALDLTGERGHGASSVVVDERGVVLTHPDYVDRMGAASVMAGAWAFCRRPSAEAFGLPSGTDWVRSHWPHLMFEAGSPYLPRPHLNDQVYIQRFGEACSLPLAPVPCASPVAWNNQGSRICVMEIRLGHLTDNTPMAGYVLWEYELVLGRRRMVADFPAGAKLGFAQLSYSADDSWIHVCDWMQGRNILIRVSDGLRLTLPFVSLAANWNPCNGPSAMIVMTPDAAAARLVIADFDLETGALERRSDFAAPAGVPLGVRELSMSADGRRALVTAPVGVSGLDQAARGGVQVAAVIDVDDGSVEPILPVRFRTPFAQRRHTSPRWCDALSPGNCGSVKVADQLLQGASSGRCAADDAAVARDFAARWLEILEETTAAWDTGRMPSDRFADEYVQYALGCYELDADATRSAVSALHARARTDPMAREVARVIGSHRSSGWRPMTCLPRPAPQTHPALTEDHPAPTPAVPAEDELTAHLDRLIAAETTGAAKSAGQALHRAIAAAGAGNDPWQLLARASAGALAGARYSFTAKLGLAAVAWHAIYRPELAASGLPRPSPAELLPIALDCFEACTHLPERTIIAAGPESIFDAQDARSYCQQALSGLPVRDYLASTPRAVPAPSRTDERAPDPADDHPAKTATTPAVARKRVFISYVREDSDIVDRLAAGLRAESFDVWLDRTHLLAGMRWQSVIRQAILSGDSFIACFSPRYVSKNSTFMNEELNIAIDRLRTMHRSRRWFFPVMLEKCQIPDYPIGPGETLASLHYLDFSRNWTSAMKSLVTALTASELTTAHDRSAKG